MKTLTLLLSLMILSCNVQKEVTKKENAQEELTVEKAVEKEVMQRDSILEKEVVQDDTTPKNENTMKQETQIEVLAQKSHGGYETSKYLVIKDHKSLQEIYGKVNRMRRPGIPVPEIDFKNEMVIALFMGEKNSGGYSIAIDKITSLSDYKVEFLLKETKPEGMATTVICQPFTFYKTLRTDKEVVFKKVE
ncbi:MAG: protease complex subunit PrcB family protein [Flavobacteriaceae bacterium]|nr:protease complex subunit PrcB family protein [Flavobacteriaceae bacterium]